jgi:DNA repair exonuclease SbcCD ATPase subunit
MRFNRLSYKNFKGQSQDIDLKNNVIVSGRNGAGKTTVIDAITWILFDKFSDGSQTLPKPLDDNNEVIKAEVEVELVTNLGTYRKTLNEKFKTVGGVTSLSGHSYEYFVNDIPVKKMEFDAKIKQSFTEQQFFIGAIPTTFLSENTHWKKRREMLQELVEMPTDEELVAKDKRLSEILQAGWTTDDYEDEKKRIKTNKDKATARYNLIEPLIEENRKSFTSTTEADIKVKSEVLIELEKERQELINQQDLSIEKKLLELKNDMKKVEMTHNSSISEITDEHNRLLRAVEAQFVDEMEEAKKTLNEDQEKLDDEKDKKEKLSDVLVETKRRRMELESELKINGANRGLYKDKYLSLTNSINELSATKGGICPTCGQDIPVDMKLNEERLARYRKEQEEIKASVKELDEKKDEITSKIVEADTEVTYTQGLVDECIQKAKELNDSISLRLSELKVEVGKKRDERVLEINLKRAEELERLGSLEERLTPFQASIQELEKQKEASKPDTSEIDLKIKDVKQEIAKAKADIELNAISRRRIFELEDERVALSEEIEKYEYKIYLIDLRSSLWAEALNDKVSSLFKIARFKMFDYIMSSGELKETCEVLYEGRATMSGGEQIYVGIDIANTLTEHWGVSMPLLVDNLQDLTKPIETDRQFIGLKTEEIDFTIKEEL